MDDTNGSYFFCFLLFHLILPLPRLIMSCFIPYTSSPSHSAVFSFTFHSSTLNPTLSLLQFNPCPSLSLSLSPPAAGQLSQSAHLALQLPYTVLGLGRSANFLDHLFVGIPRPPGGKVQTYLITHTHRHSPYGGRREESWVERPRERKNMQMAWFTSTCFCPVSEKGNIVSDTHTHTHTYI